VPGSVLLRSRFSGERLPSTARIRSMSRDFDCRAEAETAMRMAAAASCEHDRLKWLRVAQVWQDLGSVHAERRWLNDHSRVPIRIGFRLRPQVPSGRRRNPGSLPPSLYRTTNRRRIVRPATRSRLIFVQVQQFSGSTNKGRLLRVRWVGRIGPCLRTTTGKNVEIG
jgi:hypothetical protein